jgi:crossover junction endodeoxyribonuclease RuvC
MKSKPSTQTQPKIILAVDPGFDRVGVSVMTLHAGEPVVLFSECIQTKARDTKDKRLQALGARVKAVIRKWKPKELAIENLFFNTNITSAIGVAEARGVVIYEGSSAGLTLYEYAPQSIKVAVTGYGKATKGQVLLMVKKLVDLGDEKRVDDEIDAIALGITHLATTRGI